ncbi:MAG: LuxR C-terminal-related transcriptional regulator [Pseudomonadales bacterium]|nr:LuxR C-terminal-related transcriptional regulator [Pseudomonadales bacterium]
MYLPQFINDLYEAATQSDGVDLIRRLLESQFKDDEQKLPECIRSFPDLPSDIIVQQLVSIQNSNSDRSELVFLVPHIQRAIKLALKIERNQLVQEGVRSAFQFASFGLAFINSRGQVGFTNHLMGSLLDEYIEIINGKLHFKNEVLNESFYESLSKECDLNISDSETRTTLVSPLAQVRSNELSVCIYNSPLFLSQLSKDDTNHCVALIFLPSRNYIASEHSITLLFGEKYDSSLISKIVSGESYKAIAQDLNISESTIKNKARNIFKQSTTQNSTSLACCFWHIAKETNFSNVKYVPGDVYQDIRETFPVNFEAANSKLSTKESQTQEKASIWKDPAKYWLLTKNVYESFDSDSIINELLQPIVKQIKEECHASDFVNSKLADHILAHLQQAIYIKDFLVKSNEITEAHLSLFNLYPRPAILLHKDTKLTHSNSSFRSFSQVSST